MSFSVSALLLSIGSGLGFGAADYFRKVVPATCPPLLILFYFIGGQVPVLVAWLVISGETTLSAAYWPPGLAAAVAGFVANVLFIVAIRKSPLSVIIPVLSLVPAMTAVFGAIILGERITAQQIVGIALVVLGLIVVFVPPGRPIAVMAAVRGLINEPGLKPMLGAAVGWSITPAFDKLAVAAASVPVHALIQVTALVVAAGVWLTAKAGLRGFVPGKGASLPLTGAAIGAGAAYACQLAAYMMAPVAIVELVKRVTGMLCALTVGRTMFGEPVTWPKAVGIAVIAAGLPLVLIA